MKWTYTMARILVGGLFIFSGLIKVNDPVGTAIKLEEYFGVFSSNFGGIFGLLQPFALGLSLILVVLEVVLGVAVLINYRMKLTSWVLLVMILFFSFLTFYSAYTGEVTDCGCFGDAIKLTPWQSFIKDMVLLVLIVLIFTHRKKFQPLLFGLMGHVLMAAVLLVNFFLAVYAIRHLPFIDFRAYKIGSNIPKSMQPSEALRYQYIMEKEGKIFKLEEYPTDTSYQYREIVLLNPQAQPTITDYSVWNTDGEDVTAQTFRGVQLLVVIHYAEKANKSSFAKINNLIEQIDGSVGVMVITASDEPTFETFRHEVQLAAPFYFGDATVLKTIIRSNPGLLLLKDGMVLGKWHYNDVPSLYQLRQLIQ